MVDLDDQLRTKFSGHRLAYWAAVLACSLAVLHVTGSDLFAILSFAVLLVSAARVGDQVGELILKGSTHGYSG